ncbi:unnamed protein product [Rotaria sp. Silwood2]|nr:unnamed protein product [Rotaria sp. Silwood2]
MPGTDIENLLSQGECESPLTKIDDVPIESEDIHIAKVISADEIIVCYSVKPQTSEIVCIVSEHRDGTEAVRQKPFLPMNNLTNKEHSNAITRK